MLARGFFSQSQAKWSPFVCAVCIGGIAGTIVVATRFSTLRKILLSSISGVDSLFRFIRRVDHTKIIDVGPVSSLLLTSSDEAPSGKQREVLEPESQRQQENLVVNYHFLRTCNYSCKFCFHTAKTSHVASLEDAKKGLKLLGEVGMTRVNFSGGEPFLRAKMLGEMIKYCKVDLGVSTSIVSNGSKIKEKWFQE